MSGTERKLDDGTIAQGIVMLSGNGGLVDPVPFMQQDLIGNLNTPYPNTLRGYVFGKNTNVNNTYADLWQGPTARYVFPLAPQQMQIVSSSANDTAAGTGVQSVMIYYLDGNYNEQTEIVATNGLTPVLTVATDILRINGMHATKVGTVGGAAIGNISLTNTAGTITYGYITATNNSSRSGIYTVPNGYTGYISHWQLSSGTGSGSHFCQISMQATCLNGELFPGVFLTQDEQGSLNNGNAVTLPIPIPVPATADVRLSAISDTGSASATVMGAIMGWFQKN